MTNRSTLRDCYDESFQKDLCTLCSEFADIFNDKLASQAANLKPVKAEIGDLIEPSTSAPTILLNLTLPPHFN